MTWRGLFSVSVVLVVVMVFIYPFVTPRGRVVKLDVINGREHVVEKFFGLTVRDEVVDTPFTNLVTKHKLQGSPDWVTLTVNGFGLFGEFRMCGYTGWGQLGSSYRQFAADVYPHSSVDDPTTYILEMRRLAKIDHGRGVDDVVYSISNMDDWPAK